MACKILYVCVLSYLNEEICVLLLSANYSHVVNFLSHQRLSVAKYSQALERNQVDLVCASAVRQSLIV